MGGSHRIKGIQVFFGLSLADDQHVGADQSHLLATAGEISGQVDLISPVVQHQPDKVS